eukprot:CAMPEP_0178870562 /NCGR_PEP_ID=MMETSP0747-20121128/7138_1 /TAXON_ID=913974 /ORGANISM="Nitzschia punctata, Strain CCMP561" /LENGTH=81 /DNA_ID=CAMNT_0020537681 /DNA_START=999 /DNA_END=1241 /DNA_ORIENTATION=+
MSLRVEHTSPTLLSSSIDKVVRGPLLDTNNSSSNSSNNNNTSNRGNSNNDEGPDSTSSGPSMVRSASAEDAAPERRSHSIV